MALCNSILSNKERIPYLYNYYIVVLVDCHLKRAGFNRFDIPPNHFACRVEYDEGKL